VAWLFQHEDTGRTTSVALGEAEDFAKLNPRWKKANLLYTTPQPVVSALPAMQKAFDKWYFSEFKRQPNDDRHETYITRTAWQAALLIAGKGGE
jgi:hypothetical protein